MIKSCFSLVGGGKEFVYIPDFDTASTYGNWYYNRTTVGKVSRGNCD